jgi:hypothetical protein
MATQSLMGLTPTNPGSVVPSLQPRSRTALLGLPCAHCKAYYAAALEACPICGCKERTSVISKLTQ